MVEGQEHNKKEAGAAHPDESRGESLRVQPLEPDHLYSRPHSPETFGKLRDP